MNCRWFLRGKLGLILVLLSWAWLLPGPVAAAGTEVYFSPGGGAETALEKLLDGAQREINVAVYFFTSRTLAAAVLRAHARGVRIRIVLDGNDESDYSKGYYLRRRGVEVRYGRGLARKTTLDKKESERRTKNYGLMHHKFMIVDEKIVATGSYNWTAAAESWNRENLLIVNSASLARSYTAEFKKIWESTLVK